MADQAARGGVQQGASSAALPGAARAAHADDAGRRRPRRGAGPERCRPLAWGPATCRVGVHGHGGRQWRAAPTGSHRGGGICSCTVAGVACPELVPLIERGSPFDEQRSSTRCCHYLHAPAGAEAGVDTVILGCTHYPLIRPMLQRMLGRGVTLITSAEEIAREVASTLDRRGVGNDPARRGQLPLPLHRRRGRVPGGRRPLPAAAAGRGGARRRHPAGARRVNARATAAQLDAAAAGRRSSPDFIDSAHGLGAVLDRAQRGSSARPWSRSRVPGWMRGRGTGWVTSEYGMLPGLDIGAQRRATPRAARWTGARVEIQRLIGRSLRAVTDLTRAGRAHRHGRLRRAAGRRRHPHARRSAAAMWRCTDALLEPGGLRKLKELPLDYIRVPPTWSASSTATPCSTWRTWRTPAPRST